jgi:hypothetical protein
MINTLAATSYFPSLVKSGFYVAGLEMVCELAQVKGASPLLVTLILGRLNCEGHIPWRETFEVAPSL